MKEYDNFVFYEDTIIKDDILIRGPAKALKNLEVKSLKITGSLEVKGELKCTGDLQAEGPIDVEGKIYAKKIMIFRGITARVIYGETIKIVGNLTIQQNLNAKENLTLVLNPNKKTYSINGLIEAPEIILEMRIFYTKWSHLSSKILKRLGKQKKFKKTHTIRNLRIKGENLILSSPHPFDSVDYEFIDCEIDVREKLLKHKSYDLNLPF